MSNRTKGILCILLSSFGFALMNTCVKAAGDLPAFEKSFFRNLVAMIVAFVIIKRSGTSMRVEKENLKYLFARAFFGTIAIVCNFYAVDHLVLSDASMLNKMSPFFVIIFSYMILKEKLTPIQGIAVVIAFAGSLLVIKPTFANMDLFPSFIGLMGGLTSGFSYTMIRLLGKKGVPGPFIVFFFSSFSCLAAVPYLIFFFKPMTLRQVLIMLAAGIFAALGQFCITKGYFYAPAKEVSVYSFSQIIFAALLGFFLFGQTPDRYSILGYFIITGMAIMMFIYNNRINPEENVENQAKV